MEITGNIFGIVGILTSLYIAYSVAHKFYHYCQVFFFPTYPNFANYGEWSVVTGSAEGLGKAIAFQLAARGQNIVLIDRNREGLDKASKELVSKHGVRTKSLQIDFTEDDAIYTKIEEFLKNMDIGVLVNNVGMASSVTKYLDTPNLSKVLKDMKLVNMYSVYKMTQIILPGMVLRKRGLIINVSSYTCLYPLVGAAIYGATKAFVRYFSETLSYEYEDKGITVQTCMPAFIQTSMTQNIPVLVPKISPDVFAASLLGTVGKERSTHGCWKHDLEATIHKYTPLKLKHAEGRRVIEKVKETNEKKIQ